MYVRRGIERAAVVAAVLCLSASAAQAGEAEADALVRAVLQSLRLYETLQVSWVCESIPDGAAADSMSGLELFPSMRREWTATMDGLRNRLQQRQVTTFPGKDEPADVVESVSVFNGVRYRREQTSRTHPGRPRQGWEGVHDRNVATIRSQLFQLPVRLESPTAIKDWAMSAEPGGDGQSWVLTCAPPRINVAYRLTIDATRGNCVRTIECMNSDGSLKRYDVELALADYGDGQWFVSGSVQGQGDPEDDGGRGDIRLRRRRQPV